MDKRDILISDVRVTALANEGPYDFDWVDKDDKVITLTDKCKFSTVPEQIANVIRKHDIEIVEDDLEVKKDNDSEQNEVDLIDTGSNNSSNENNFSTTEFVDSGNEKSHSGRKPDLIGEPTKDLKNKENFGKDNKSNYVSFIVRMDNPKDRDKIVKQLNQSNNDAADKLKLTGPYRVIYEVKDNTIELVGMEDMGIGSEEGKTDV